MYVDDIGSGHSDWCTYWVASSPPTTNPPTSNPPTTNPPTPIPPTPAVPTTGCIGGTCCDDICTGTYPYGCANGGNVQGKDAYQCQPNGHGCMYVDDIGSGHSDWCTYWVASPPANSRNLRIGQAKQKLSIRLRGTED